MNATAVYEERVQVSRARLLWAARRGITLGHLLARAHEDTHVHGVADCPVCGGHLAARALDARCDDCGAHLS